MVIIMLKIATHSAYRYQKNKILLLYSYTILLWGLHCNMVRIFIEKLNKKMIRKLKLLKNVKRWMLILTVTLVKYSLFPGNDEK